MEKNNINKELDYKAVFLYENKNNFKIYMTGLNDTSKMIQNIGFFITNNEGDVSEVFPIKRSKLINSKTALNFIYDFMGEFCREDVNQIKRIVDSKISEIPEVTINEKVPVMDAYRMLCRYVIDNQVENEVFLDKEGYCNINTKVLLSVVNNLELGYKPLEIKRAFKVLNVLVCDKGRTYEYTKYTKARESYRTIRFINIIKEERND